MITTSSADVRDGPGPVIPVNLVGAMGEGLALAARRRWPALYAYYREYLTVGRLAGTATGDNMRLAHRHAPSDQAVMLLPTKGGAHRDTFRATIEAPA